MAEKEATAIKEKRNNLQFQYKNKRLAVKKEKKKKKESAAGAARGDLSHNGPRPVRTVR